MNPDKDPEQFDPKLVRERLFRRAWKAGALAVMNAVVLTMDDDPLPTDNNQVIADITAESIRNVVNIEKMVKYVHWVLGTRYSEPNNA